MAGSRSPDPERRLFGRVKGSQRLIRDDTVGRMTELVATRAPDREFRSRHNLLFSVSFFCRLRRPGFERPRIAAEGFG